MVEGEVFYYNITCLHLYFCFFLSSFAQMPLFKIETYNKYNIYI